VIFPREGKVVVGRLKRASQGESEAQIRPPREERGRHETRESDARECDRASESKLQKSLGGSRIQRSASRRFA